MAIVTEVEDMATAMEAEDMAIVTEAEDMDTAMEAEDMATVTDIRESQQRRKEKSSVRNFTPTGMTTRRMRRSTSLPSGSMR